MALAFLAYLALLLTRSHGHFSYRGILATSVAIGAYGVLRARQRTLPMSRHSGARAVAIVITAFSASMLMDSELLYASEAPWSAALRVALGITFGVVLVRLLMTWDARGPLQPPRALRLVDALAITLLLAAQYIALRASPSPQIDVVSMLREAIDVLLSGHNPYTAIYSDAYGQGLPPPVTYFPGVFWPLAPFQSWLGDFRLAYVAGSGVAAAGIYRLARDEGHEPRDARLWSLLWLSFPVSLFVVEQGWAESLLVPLAIWSLIAIRTERWILAGVLIGYACAIKPSVAVLAWFAALVALSSGWVSAARLGAAVAVTFATVVLPFASADPRAFYDGTIGFLLRQPLSETSHSLPSFVLVVWQRVPPSWIGVAVAAILAGIALPWWMFRQMSRGLGSSELGTLAFPLALSYVVSFFVVQNGYANYYYYAALFVLVDGLALNTAARAPRTL